MSAWRRIEIEYVADTPAGHDDIETAVVDAAAELLEGRDWSASASPAPDLDPEPECICGPQPLNGMVYRSDCARHSFGYMTNAGGAP